MANLASADRLNILYYGEMNLPTVEKKLRIVMAGAFQDAVRKYYDTVHTIITDEKTDKHRKDILLAAAVVSLCKAYLGFFDKYYERYVAAIFRGGEPYYGVDAWRNQHALDFAVWLTRTARGEPNVAFEKSHSITVTRTEINAMCNLAALDGAYRSGMRFKTWVTFGDGKVRASHRAVGGTRIPIDEAFTVGGYKLMFPNDTSLGAGAEEIVNCRCTLKFDDGKPLTNPPKSGIIEVKKFDIAADKIYKFLLLPGAKHSEDFFNVGYTVENAGRLLRDIENQFDTNKAVDKKFLSDGVEKFSIFMQLGVNKTRRFRTVWQIDSGKTKPRFISAHREDE